MRRYRKRSENQFDLETDGSHALTRDGVLELCVSSSANWRGADCNFEAGMGLPTLFVNSPSDSVSELPNKFRVARSALVGGRMSSNSDQSVR